jgi:putative transposase
MNNDLSLNHSRWECKYHVVWIPKYRRKTLFGQLRQYLGQVFKELAISRESEVLERHMMLDHVHMLISIPPNTRLPRLLGLLRVKVQFI